MVDHMSRRIVAVRPRVGTALERIQEATDNDMSNRVHEWAEADEQGWLEQFNLSKHEGGERDEDS